MPERFALAPPGGPFGTMRIATVAFASFGTVGAVASLANGRPIGVLFAVVLLAFAAWSLREAPARSAAFLELDDEGIRLVAPNGGGWHYIWSDLRSVALLRSGERDHFRGGPPGLILVFDGRDFKHRQVSFHSPLFGPLVGGDRLLTLLEARGFEIPRPSAIVGDHPPSQAA